MSEFEISPRAAEKVDAALETRLRRAPESERLRLIARLAPAPRRASLEQVSPTEFSSRADYRAKLIRLREQEKSGQADVRRSLEKLGVVVRGGAILDQVVLEGSPAALRQALELAGVERARLDERIRLVDAPSRKR